MSDHVLDDRGMDRRRLLRGAGIAAVAGTGLAVLNAESAGAAMTQVTAIDVKASPYNATGNGSTDDRAAIQAALNDVPANGGVVYFPPGDYVVGGPLLPKSRTLMYGSHTPRWDGADNPSSASKIRCSGTFSGAAMINPASGTVSVTMRNLALVGNGVGTGVHGVNMPSTGNSSWSFENMTIASFSGSGVNGRVHVATFDNCYVHNNRRYGFEATGGNQWNDVHVSNCFLFYNRQGNVYYGGSGITAAVDFVNCRFERAGTNPANVMSPLNSDAPGLRLSSCRQLSFVNCNTDANTGFGVDIAHETVDYCPNHLQFTNCRFARDGTGNQSTQPDRSGIRVVGHSGVGQVGQIKFVNCFVSSGKADDAGGGTVVGPKYGVIYEHTVMFEWIGGNLAPATAAWNGAGGGSNWRPTIVDIERGLLTLPVDAPNSSQPIPDGAVYFDGGTNRIRVRNGSVWRSVTLT